MNLCPVVTGHWFVHPVLQLVEMGQKCYCDLRMEPVIREQLPQPGRSYRPNRQPIFNLVDYRDLTAEPVAKTFAVIVNADLDLNKMCRSLVLFSSQLACRK